MRYALQKQCTAGVDTWGPIAFIYAHWAFECFKRWQHDTDHMSRFLHIRVQTQPQNRPRLLTEALFTCSECLKHASANTQTNRSAGSLKLAPYSRTKPKFVLARSRFTVIPNGERLLHRHQTKTPHEDSKTLLTSAEEKIGRQPMALSRERHFAHCGLRRR